MWLWQDGTHDSVQDAKTALRLYMLKSKAWEKQMRSAMTHRGVIDEEEDTGEQVERSARLESILRRVLTRHLRATKTSKKLKSKAPKDARGVAKKKKRKKAKA